MKNNSNLPKKKIWAKPEIYLLDTNDVNGGSGTAYKEGAPVGSGKYEILFNGGGLFGIANKGIWENYHS